MDTSIHRRENRRVRHAGVLLRLMAGLAVLVGSAAPLAAQQEGDPARVPLAGRVTDRSSGRPLPGAVVEAGGPRLTATTDAQGRFTFRRLRPGTLTFRVSLLGYQDLDLPVLVAADADTVSFRLEPDPVLLEGLTVSLDVLEQRMKRVPFAARAFNREQIRANRPSSVEAFVRGRGGVAAVTCTLPFADACVWSRGRFVPVAVYLDELPIYSLGFLTVLRPDEVERIEVYQNGRHVRVYTSRFMEDVARGRRRLTPVFVY